jgi:glyoxylase-like metal-dependent hydrolase (beta-lactamase superfamily II)
MKIHCIYGLDYDSNVYVIDGKKPTIIDTGTGLHQKYLEDKIKEIIDPLKISQIVLTHEHFDHTGGIKNFYDLSNENAKIVAHRIAAKKIESGKSDFARMLGSKMQNMPVDFKLSNNDKILFGDSEFEVIYTPGHTPGCVCFYEKKSKSLISGDTIFAYGSFGRYDFPEGDEHELKKSIEKVSKFDVENLYPGHESIVEGEANKHIKKSLENINLIGII